MKESLKLFGERVLGSIVFLMCLMLCIPIQKVDEDLANAKQLIRRRPRYMPSRFALILTFSQEAATFVKKGLLLLLGFALIYLLFCLAFAM
jgi:hypothetical protein